MTSISQKSCIHCKHSQSLSADKYQCRKNPPVVLDLAHGIGRFPIVGETIWCSEFAPKPKRKQSGGGA